MNQLPNGPPAVRSGGLGWPAVQSLGTFLATVLVIGAALARIEAAVEFHVAPGGNDANPGSGAQPFRTLERARDAVRAQSVRAGSTVTVHGGVYTRETALEFGAADSGAKAAPVLWRAAPGETVRLVGGKVVPATAVRPVADPAILARVLAPDARAKLLEVDLTALGVRDCGQIGPRGFRRPYLAAPVELFLAGQALTLARWPNVGENPVPMGKVLDAGPITRNGEKPLRGGQFVVPTDRPRQWAKAREIWISGFFNYGFADDTVKLASITETNNQLVFRTEQCHMYGFSSGQPWNAWFALNLIEEIDLPGEYALDREAGKLYFLPPAGVDVGQAEMMISTLEPPVVALENASHVRFENLHLECSRGLGVYLERGESVVFSGCTFRNLGILAVCIGQGVAPDPLYRHAFTGTPVGRQLGSWHEHIYDNPAFNRQAGRNHRLENCLLADLGAGGVSLGGGDRLSLEPAGNTVFNCEIRNVNRWDRTYKTSVNIDGVGNRIAHCLIRDAAGSAIYLHGNSHVIENNEFYRVLTEGDDMGAVYLGRDPSEFGTVIRSNYFHEVGFGRGHGTFALYYDDGACGAEAYGNVFFKAGRRATIFINDGNYNQSHDNIFVECAQPIMTNPGFRAESAEVIASRLKLVKFDQPPFSVRHPALAAYYRDDPATRSNPVVRNLLVRSGALPGNSPQACQTQDNWQTASDPGFVDAAQGNFRLKPGAEAFIRIVGFKPGDFSQMGLVHPKPPNQ
jgi:hypothetical protein